MSLAGIQFLTAPVAPLDPRGCKEKMPGLARHFSSDHASRVAPCAVTFLKFRFSCRSRARRKLFCHQLRELNVDEGDGPIRVVIASRPWAVSPFENIHRRDAITANRRRASAPARVAPALRSTVSSSAVR